MVSSASVTGAQNTFGETQQKYFDRISSMDLKTPQIVGFGISNSETFTQATRTTKGAIVGSAFIKHLTEHGINNITSFIKTLRT